MIKEYYDLIYILLNLVSIDNLKTIMKILITGGDGMLGSNLVRILLNQKHEVSVFIHPSSRSKTLDNLNITKYYGCILQLEEINAAVKGHEIIIHAAASTDIWPARSEKVRSINIDGTKNIISSALANNIRRFIYVGSASSVNATTDQGSKYAFPGAKYGLDYIDSKYIALNLVLDAVKNNGLPALAILPTYMIGSYDLLPGSGKMIQALASGKLKFYTKGGRNFVSAKDVAIAISNSLEMGQIGKYYVAGHENLTYQEFFSKVAKIVDRKEPQICVPGWLVKSIGYLGDLSGVILKKPPLLSYPMARISCDKQFVSSNDAIKELGMPQTKIEEAILDCYNWFMQNGYLEK
jgi:dihydroflavonol-4-reductase